MIEGAHYLKSLVVSHGLPRHLYFIIFSFVNLLIVAKINLKLESCIMCLSR